MAFEMKKTSITSPPFHGCTPLSMRYCFQAGQAVLLWEEGRDGGEGCLQRSG